MTTKHIMCVGGKQKNKFLCVTVVHLLTAVIATRYFMQVSR